VVPELAVSDAELLDPHPAATRAVATARAPPAARILRFIGTPMIVNAAG
jgi:hypothetical protein